MKYIFLIIFFTLTGHAKTNIFKFNLDGNILDHTKSQQRNLEISIKWSCVENKKYLGIFSNYVSCGFGEEFFPVLSDGSFQIKEVRTKRGDSSDNTLSIMIYRRENDERKIIGHMYMPANRNQIQENFNTISLYQIERKILDIQLKSGSDSLEWINGIGKYTGISYTLIFHDVSNPKQNRIKLYAKNDINNGKYIDTTTIILNGDMGHSPIYDLEVDAYNVGLSRYIESDEYSIARFSMKDRPFTGVLTEDESTLFIDDTSFPRE